VRRVAFMLGLVASCGCGFALNPGLDISQYAHTAWTVRDGFSLGNIYAIAQTPDGYLWLGTEFGLFRFDGVRSIQWQPPAGQHLPDKNINSLLVTRDGTLWIGTFAGLVTWNGGKLTQRPEQELAKQFVASLFEDSEGTVWAGTLATSGRLCAIRGGSTQCYGEDGAFGIAVWALYEERSGNLWAAAQSGLWRMRPGPPKQYPTPTELIGLSKADNERLLVAVHGGELLQLASDKLELYPIRGAIHSNELLRGRAVDSNRVLRDRDGGLWIGTVERGLIHIHQGRTDVFTRSDGLSGDVILSLFEDREGTVWVASTGGLDRFRELPVSTVSVRQGLSSDATQSVLAAADGSIWVGAHEGLTRWKNGQATIFRKASGLPDDAPESLFQDDRGRIWVSTRHGLAYFKDGRFVAGSAVRGEVHFMTGDKAGNLWLSEHQSLLHLRDGLVVEQIPWSKLGRRQTAEFVLSGGEPGGVWLGFWVEGGVSYFKDGQFRASYTAADGLGKGGVPDLQLDPDGALWAATQDGGLSRIKDGRIATLTSRNGLPCDAIHWSIEDDDHSFWLYTSCGLMRIARSELDAWIANPKRTVETAVWDAADGVRLRSSAASAYGPRVAKSPDGKLWFVTGEGVQVVDPHHLAFNKLPPPVHIERIVADDKPYDLRPGMRLPANVRNLRIDYTALSLVAPEKIHLKYKLEGQNRNWHEVINERHATYTNLSPRNYRFRVIASNNNGVWNETGDALEFSIAPAYYQTTWFYTSCVAVVLAMVWMAYQFRVRQLQRQYNMRVEERVEERTRIARELHDTLLQTVQGFMLRLQAVNEMMPPGAVKNEHEQTLEIGDRAIAEGRKTVQDLRSAFTTSDLVEAVRAVGDELASRDAAAFRVVVEGPVRDLNPIVRDEVYSIAREGLRNAFTHACAAHIDAEITFDERVVRLRIRDDGKGIAPAVAEQGRAGHYGVAGMQERARRIGAKLAILSGAGTGTEIDLTVAGSIAYAKPRGGRFRFSQLRNLMR